MQSCTGVQSHVCPQGNETALITSYYDWETRRARSDYLNTFGAGSELFQVFQSESNQGLNWDVFVLPTNESMQLSCVRTQTPGSFPRPDRLRDTTYEGRHILFNQECDVWRNEEVWTKGNTIDTYVNAVDGKVVGFRSAAQGTIQQVLEMEDTVPAAALVEPDMSCQQSSIPLPMLPV
eukprot:CAMPEP_0175807640 /NCGR_PEP_ID=MMETSP0107_2-20121207/1828_1 /TAXON_ID=195067 ORGANISM="Goniomonas pacifica, Strain CCMP1869" /NCGR_SAMPLE_ID=MMETSP0107_2 /ASSEMBLY_ACC=CAM_ASM_000203 /LENGTH=177 /DNA_ID=CAMNT_0017119203 /DNA_START=106 /DNA_END=639 /DNA_ORIENTATION=+